jgi:hypothetical protein
MRLASRIGSVSRSVNPLVDESFSFAFKLRQASPCRRVVCCRAESRELRTIDGLPAIGGETTPSLSTSSMRCPTGSILPHRPRSLAFRWHPASYCYVFLAFFFLSKNDALVTDKASCASV